EPGRLRGLGGLRERGDPMETPTRGGVATPRRSLAGGRFFACVAEGQLVAAAGRLSERRSDHRRDSDGVAPPSTSSFAPVRQAEARLRYADVEWRDAIRN